MCVLGWEIVEYKFDFYYLQMVYLYLYGGGGGYIYCNLPNSRAHVMTIYYVYT